MKMEYLSLQQLLSVLNSLGNYHICIHDVSGILKGPLTVSHENAIHSREFCSLAKSTQKGFDTCMHCKNLANLKAIRTGEAFQGQCAFGLYEMARPVVIDGKIRCIIYLGNIVADWEETVKRLERTCRRTGSPREKMEAELAKAQKDAGKLADICELIDSYIRLLYGQQLDIAQENTYHWAVSNLIKYAEDNYSQAFTLESVCRLYFINEKYAGKLFKEQTGMSFHEYLNKIRLQKAARELERTDCHMIDIAFQCGFKNVTYFNRKFREAYGMAPGEYRKKYREADCVFLQAMKG